MGRVVTGAAWDLERLDPERPGRPADGGRHPARDGDRRFAGDPAKGGAQMAPGSYGLDLVGDAAPEVVEPFLLGTARLGPEVGFSRYDVMGTGPDLEATGRRHAAGGEPLDGEGNLGCPQSASRRSPIGVVPA